MTSYNGNSIANRLQEGANRRNAAEYRAQFEYDVVANPLYDAYEEASEAGDRERAREIRAQIKALGPRPIPGVTNI